jgi:hypothetical protein
MLQFCRLPDGWAEVRVTPQFFTLAGLILSTFCTLHDKKILYQNPGLLNISHY